ncbi:MAG: translation initiation factor [Gaiella sp.]
MAESRLVYSTSDGDQRRDRSQRRRTEPTPGPSLPDDGVVRVFREKGGRGGEVVTVVRGLPGGELDTVARDLKRRCATGGAVKGGAIELQGDHRDAVAARLSQQGKRVKLAGG